MTSLYTKRVSARSRRGANALEFALILPVLSAMLMGTIDYGYFYSQQNSVVSAMNGAIRAGSNVMPAIGENSGCAECVGVVTTQALNTLDYLGISASMSQVTPTIERIEGTCALVFDTTFDHKPLVGMVDVPTSYPVKLVALLVNVQDC